MRAVLCFDEGPGAGLGHRRRMEAVAAALTARAHTCTLVPLPVAELPACDVLVVDSYRQRADDRAFAAAPLVAAVDDLARDLAVALVVDPSPGALGAAHRRARRVLAGAAYALVLPPEPGVHETAVGAPVTRILVTTGAADVDGIGAQVAADLASHVPGVEVRLVVGPWGSPEVPAGVVPVHAPDGLAPELAGAGLVVTAGGVALLEACLFGRPIIAMALAANQRQAVHGLEREGAVVVATPDTVADAAAVFVADADRRLQIAAAARRAVNGDGAARVADMIEHLAAQTSVVR